MNYEFTLWAVVWARPDGDYWIDWSLIGDTRKIVEGKLREAKSYYPDEFARGLVLHIVKFNAVAVPAKDKEGDYYG